ncbi:MAG TPA: hypothetical protein VJ385_19070 [Fibrobacteria bacterium]|nr:hypothetical protein [Fibrobacteria bacterium]
MKPVTALSAFSARFRFPVFKRFVILAGMSLAASPLSASEILLQMRVPSLTLGLEYDMATGLISSPGPKTGDEADVRATVEYAFTSNPFLYDFNFFDLTRQVSPGLWSYEYAVRNSDLSTFDISGILIPGLWDLKPRLEPGFDFAIPATLSSVPPAETFATLFFDDLAGTQKQVRVLAPVAIASVPEPSAFALYGMCAAAGCLLMGMLGQKPARIPDGRS